MYVYIYIYICEIWALDQEMMARSSEGKESPEINQRVRAGKPTCPAIKQHSVSVCNQLLRGVDDIAFAVV